jgi:hypothetical protein
VSVKNTGTWTKAHLADDSMTIWKKLYFATAMISAVFLAVSLF